MSAGQCVLDQNKVKGKKLTLKKEKVLDMCTGKKAAAANKLYGACLFFGLQNL